MDGVDYETNILPEHIDKISQINTQIVGKSTLFDYEYYFPDSVYTENELCTLYSMFSHIFVNSSISSTPVRVGRRRRDTYSYGTSGNGQFNVDNVHSIQEKGVVTFRQDRNEAIAPARVLYGIIAAYAPNPVKSTQEILSKLNINKKTTTTLTDEIFDVTLGNLMASSMFDSQNSRYDASLIYGVNGEWQNTSCCTYYGIPLANGLSLYKLRISSRGSLAEIRGGLDGYIIGTYLKKHNTVSLSLSKILKSYYSKPHLATGSEPFVSYCDRATYKPQAQVISNDGNAFKEVYTALTGEEKFPWKSENFQSTLEQASKTNSGRLH